MHLCPRSRRFGPSIMVLGIVICAIPAGVPGQLRQVTQPPSAAPAIFAGVLAGAGGLVAGAFLGASMVCSGASCEDFEALGGAVLGAALGEVLLLPIGVHLGNRSAGSLELDLLMSVTAGAVSLALATASEDGGVLLAGIIAQVGLTVWTERRTGRRSGPLRNANLLVRPSGGGEMLVGLSVR